MRKIMRITHLHMLLAPNLVPDRGVGGNPRAGLEGIFTRPDMRVCIGGQTQY